MNTQRLIATTIVVCLALAGCRSVPSTPDPWIRILEKPHQALLTRDSLCAAIDRVVHDDDLRARPYLCAIVADANLPLAVRTQAAHALGQLRDGDALTFLLSAVENESMDGSLREVVAKALCRYPDDRVIPVLVRAVARRLSGADAFYELFGQRDDKARAVPDLIGLLEFEARYDIRTRGTGATAARALGQIGDARAVEPLMKAAEGNNRDTKAAAIEALGEIRDARCVPLLLRLAERNEGPFGHYAIDAIGRIGDASAVPRLCAMVSDRESNWPSAVSALGAIGDHRAEACLMNRLLEADRDSDPYSTRILQALTTTCGRDTETARIARFCSSPDRYQRQAAATTLGNIGNPAVVKDVVPLLEDEDYHVREAAIAAMGNLPSPDTIRGLLDSLVRDKACSEQTQAKFAALVRVCGEDLAPIVELLDQTGYASGAAHAALSVFVTRQDARYVVPAARCFLATRALSCAGCAVKFDGDHLGHSEAAQFLVRMAATHPDALRDVDNKDLRDLWAKALQRARGNGRERPSTAAGAEEEAKPPSPAPTP